MERRLAAILVADVAGFSRLAGADEEATLAELEGLRVMVVDPTIAEHGGRVFKTTGDGLLAAFPSVVEAVRCAAQIQQALACPREDTDVDRRMALRIAVHVGDVVVSGNDLLGDGVNIAARLEQLAEPGGICISGAVHEQVRDRLPSLRFADGGEHALHNIVRPLRIWHLAPPAPASAGEHPSAVGPAQVALPQAPPASDLPYRFGRAEVRPVERQLVIDGRPAAAGARAFDVLLALIERRERVVSKNELLDLAWPGLVVEENNLQVQISTLRKLLGTQAIATIPGRGYRFALPIDAVPQVSGTLDVSPLRAAEGAQTTNLPDELPRLYGRDKEIGEVVQLLAEHRLVTILGAGGIGKTCLGQAVAHKLRGRFVDGVWLVDLAALSDPARVAGTLAHALNMPVSDEARAFDAAIDAVRGKQLLLVLDNCEHVLGEVGTLAAAIRRHAPGTTLLATSQEPLKVADEHVYRLGTLAVAPPGTVPNADAATEYGAVALFVARAQAADPRFALNAHNVDAILDICWRLDGIALALELAAARVPLLGVEGMRSRLDERFNLLTGGVRTALRRHQTLRAALEWSHALLSGTERTVFRRLGVFVGGFALEAAQQVACDETMDAWEVLDHLGALVDKSFVLVDGADPPRYRLLETGRAYALERLAAASETETLARRHAQIFAALFEGSFAERWQARPAVHFARYRPELDNLRAALNWCSHHDPHLEVALAGAAAWLWSACALRAEGIATCERAISHLDATTPPALEARVLSELAHVGAMGVIAVDRALQALERAIALYRGLNDRVGLYVALARQASFLEAAGDTVAAGSALAQTQALGDPAWPPRLQLEGLFALNTSSVDQFRALQEERCRLARLAEDELEELLGLKDLVYTDMMLGRFDVAIRDGCELAERFRHRGFASHVGYVLAELSVALTLNGELDEAVRVLRKAVSQLTHAGVVWRQLALFALIAFLRGRKDSAARLLGAEEVIFENSGHRRIWDEQRTHDEVSDRLQQAFAPDVLARLMREGALMQEKSAVALALRELESIEA